MNYARRAIPSFVLGALVLACRKDTVAPDLRIAIEAGAARDGAPEDAGSPGDSTVASGADAASDDAAWNDDAPNDATLNDDAPNDAGLSADALTDDGGNAVVLDAGPVGAPIAVVEHHNSPARDGLFVTPGLTRAVAATAHRVTDFDGTFTGILNSQPLYVPDGPDGGGSFYVVTESNDVLAFDEQTGAAVWATNLGLTATHTAEGCGIPATAGGITSTPYIDLASRTLYTDSMLAVPDDAGAGRGLVTHLIHALSIDDGTERAGWPVDPSGLISNGNPFLTDVALQRGALALVEGMLYVSYGSIGDCGHYRGTVVAIDVDEPNQVTAWAAPGLQAGVWASSGVSSDGENVFFATGNGAVTTVPEGGAAPPWAGGEAVYRFRSGPLADTADDYYVAPGWQQLDQTDGDLGASGVLLLDQPQSTPSKLAVVFGKDGYLYLLDAMNMGSAIGPPIVFFGQVATRNIVSAAAAVPNDQGTLVVVDAQTNGVGFGCPSGEAGDLVAVEIVAGAPPTAQVVWCQWSGGHGSPIITTTDGRAEPVVWISPSDIPNGGKGSLTAFDASNGAPLFKSPDVLTGTSRFNTLIVANGRVVVGANGGLVAFGF
jgi:hypothetical protein